MDFDARHGSPVPVAERVVRVTAPNAGPFTYKGTNTYIVGNSELMVIDPGPDDDRHLDCLTKTIAGRRVSHILVTHTHADHSPLAARLKNLTGANVAGFGRHSFARPLFDNEVNILDASADLGFIPDRFLKDGDIVSNMETSLEAIHTPGHSANHLCFAVSGTSILFSGDHIMAWSTTIVAPPDGSMDDYLVSIDKLRKRRETFYLPGHGGVLSRPAAFLRGVKAHRLMREAAILEKLAQGACSIGNLVEAIYRDTDKQLHGAAALTVHAHLERLVGMGLVGTDGSPTLDARYCLIKRA